MIGFCETHCIFVLVLLEYSLSCRFFYYCEVFSTLIIGVDLFFCFQLHIIFFDWLIVFRVFPYSSDKSESYCFCCLTQSTSIEALWFVACGLLNNGN